MIRLVLAVVLAGGCVEPIGEAPACDSDAECAAAEVCDDAGCAPHGCPTEPAAACRAVRPDCGAEGVAVVSNGCWACVSLATCQPSEP